MPPDTTSVSSDQPPVPPGQSAPPKPWSVPPLTSNPGNNISVGLLVQCQTNGVNQYTLMLANINGYWPVDFTVAVDSDNNYASGAMAPGDPIHTIVIRGKPPTLRHGHQPELHNTTIIVSEEGTAFSHTVRADSCKPPST